MSDNKKHKPYTKRYATINAPMINYAVDKAVFEKEKLKGIFNTIRSRYVAANPDKEGENNIYDEARVEKSDDKILIWIGNYWGDLDGEKLERYKETYKGNYALISYKDVGDDKLQFTCEMKEVDISKHPQRVTKLGKHPNWGYPMLRYTHNDRNKNPSLYTKDKALDMLEKLTIDFPEVTIYNVGAEEAYTMIYAKAYGDENDPSVSRVKKFVVKIEEDKDKNSDDRYYFDVYENKHKSGIPKKNKKIEQNNKQKSAKRHPIKSFLNWMKKKVSDFFDGI